MQIIKPADATAVLWKNEDAADNTGPAWFAFTDRPAENVINSDMNDWNGDPFPAWIPRGTAIDMARHFKLPFQEV